MQALVLKATHQPLELETRPPLQPGHGEVVVALKAAALNRRDFWITQGMYPGIKPPVILGSDGAGVVKRVGSGVDQSLLGREVIMNPGMAWGDDERAQSADFHILGLPTDGTFATEVVVSAQQLHDRPEHLNWQEAAALPLGGVTAWRALMVQGRMQSGHAVLITGIGGGVATFALQFAVAAGANVWVTSSSDEKIARAVELGAKGGLNYTQSSWPDDLKKAAGAPDVIIDSAGGPGYSQLINLAAPGARIVNYGATAGAPPKFDLFKVFWKQLNLVGSTMGSPADFAAMLEFVNTHHIRPIVDESFPLKDGNSAIESMKSSPQFGKLVLTMDR